MTYSKQSWISSGFESSPQQLALAGVISSSLTQWTSRVCWPVEEKTFNVNLDKHFADFRKRLKEFLIKKKKIIQNEIKRCLKFFWCTIYRLILCQCGNKNNHSMLSKVVAWFRYSLRRWCCEIAYLTPNKCIESNPSTFGQKSIDSWPTNGQLSFDNWPTRWPTSRPSFCRQNVSLHLQACFDFVAFLARNMYRRCVSLHILFAVPLIDHLGCELRVIIYLTVKVTS